VERVAVRHPRERLEKKEFLKTLYKKRMFSLRWSGTEDCIRYDYRSHELFSFAITLLDKNRLQSRGHKDRKVGRQPSRLVIEKERSAVTSRATRVIARDLKNGKSRKERREMGVGS